VFSEKVTEGFYPVASIKRLRVEQATGKKACLGKLGGKGSVLADPGWGRVRWRVGGRGIKNYWRIYPVAHIISAPGRASSVWPRPSFF